MKRSSVHFLLAIFLLAVSAPADNLQVKNGRLDGVEVTVLTLTDEQLLTVRTKRVFVLTRQQRDSLTQAAGVAPTVLSVYSLRQVSDQGIHACGEFNFGLWFSERNVEVPHLFLVTDEKAAEMADALEEL